MCRPDDFPPYDPIFTTKTVGSRYASKVTIRTPQGSCYDGATGIVVNEHPDSRTVMVRLDQRFGGLTLPFGRGEIARR